MRLTRLHSGSLGVLLVLPLTLIDQSSSLASQRFDALFFAAPGQSTYEHLPYRPLVADLNGDGFPDIVTARGCDSLSILLGQVGGSPASPFSVSAPVDNFMTSADFDGDGALDIGIGGWSGSAILFGNGSATHWTRLDLPVIHGLASMATDCDEDGHPDLVIFSREDTPPYLSTVHTFLTRADRSFEVITSPCDSLSGSDIASVQVADFDRDGRDDIAVLPYTYPDPPVILLFGKGDGTFITRAVRVASPSCMSVADATEDGIADLIVGSGNFALVILPGLGDGTFTTGMNLAPPPTHILSIAVADMTGDGHVDIVTSEMNPGVLKVRPGLGGGAYGPPVEAQIGPSLNPAVIADMDADGRLDVVGLAENSAGVWVGLGDGAGRFGTAPVDVFAFPPSAGLAMLAVGDLNGDALPDIAIGVNGITSHVEVRVGGPGRSWSLSWETTLPSYPHSLQLGDFDEDGVLDLLVATFNNRLLLFLGNGDATFTLHLDAPLPDLYSRVSVVDVTGDGHLDVVHALNLGVRVIPSTGTGTLGSPMDSPMPYEVIDVVVGDLNGDELPDLGLGIKSNYWGSTTYGVLRSYNQGVGAFTPGEVTWFDNPPTIAIGDLTGDGRGDLLMDLGDCSFCWNRCIWVQVQGSDGVLGPIQQSSWGLAAHGARLAHVNDDLNLDVLQVSRGGTVLSMGDGAGHFFIDSGIWASGAEFADFDLDGRIDLIGERSLLTSNRVLSVSYGRDPTPPSITLTNAFPQVLSIGQAFGVTWIATDDVGIEGIDVFVSWRGKAGPYERVAVGQPNTGSYPWIVTAPLSDSVVFKVVARDSAGNAAPAWSQGLSRIGDPLGIGTASRRAVRPRLIRIAPNPVRTRITVEFELPREDRVHISLYDLQGRLAGRLLDETRPGGFSRVTLGLSDVNRRLVPGLYMMRLVSKSGEDVARIALLE